LEIRARCPHSLRRFPRAVGGEDPKSDIQTPAPSILQAERRRFEGWV